MIDTAEPGLPPDEAKGTMFGWTQLGFIACPFCHGDGELDLGEKDGVKIVRPCNPCAGIGLLHPARVKRIKERFNTEGEHA